MKALETYLYEKCLKDLHIKFKWVGAMITVSNIWMVVIEKGADVLSVAQKAKQNQKVKSTRKFTIVIMTNFLVVQTANLWNRLPHDVVSLKTWRLETAEWLSFRDSEVDQLWNWDIQFHSMSCVLAKDWCWCVWIAWKMMEY